VTSNLPPLWKCPKCGERFITKTCGTRAGSSLWYAPHFIGHTFRVYSEADLDADVQRWMCEAYEVGEQKHLKRKSAAKRGPATTQPREAPGA
jgi:hypothetical protein